VRVRERQCLGPVDWRPDHPVALAVVATASRELVLASVAGHSCPNLARVDEVGVDAPPDTIRELLCSLDIDEPGLDPGLGVSAQLM